MLLQYLRLLIFIFIFQLNPQHTIPTLNDNGFVLWESRAIQSYLVEQYAKTDSLYPKDAKKRAVVNQRLYFDMGTLYGRFADYYYPQVFAKAPADPEKYKKIEEAFEFLDTILATSGQYAAGDNLTIADISLIATVSSYEVAKFDFSKYTNVKKWYDRATSVTPGIDINKSGVEQFANYFKGL